MDSDRKILAQQSHKMDSDGLWQMLVDNGVASEDADSLHGNIN
jgi:hypothetical protein